MQRIWIDGNDCRHRDRIIPDAYATDSPPEGHSTSSNTGLPETGETRPVIDKMKYKRKAAKAPLNENPAAPGKSKTRLVRRAPKQVPFQSYSSEKNCSTFTFSQVLSNSTYIRKLYLRASSAATLFPCISKSLHALGHAPPKLSRGNAFNMRHIVHLQDGQGRRWDVVFEYIESKKQRHSRLNIGWSQICKANDYRGGVSICLQREELSEGYIVSVNKN